MAAAPFELKCNVCDYVNVESATLEMMCPKCGKGIMVKRE